VREQDADGIGRAVSGGAEQRGAAEVVAGVHGRAQRKRLFDGRGVVLACRVQELLVWSHKAGGCQGKQVRERYRLGTNDTSSDVPRTSAQASASVFAPSCGSRTAPSGATRL